jgi:hypothetical protein
MGLLVFYRSATANERQKTHCTYRSVRHGGGLAGYAVRSHTKGTGILSISNYLCIASLAGFVGSMWVPPPLPPYHFQIGTVVTGDEDLEAGLDGNHGEEARRYFV